MRPGSRPPLCRFIGTALAFRSGPNWLQDSAAKICCSGLPRNWSRRARGKIGSRRSVHDKLDQRTMEFHDPNSLVQTDWLASRLDDPALRIFDCTTHLRPAQAGTNAAYQIVSGRAEYDAAHIPGAGFLDLQGELSDNSVR